MRKCAWITRIVNIASQETSVGLNFDLCQRIGLNTKSYIQ